MAGPLDPEDIFWTEIFKNTNAVRAWNAALWEAAKLILNEIDRKEALEALRDMRKGRE